MLKRILRLGEVILSEPNSNYWIVEFTTNRLLAVNKSRATSKEYTVFYQPSILPHILPGS